MEDEHEQDVRGDELVECNEDFRADDEEYTSITEDLAIGYPSIEAANWGSAPSFLLILQDGKKVFICRLRSTDCLFSFQPLPSWDTRGRNFVQDRELIHPGVCLTKRDMVAPETPMINVCFNTARFLYVYVWACVCVFVCVCYVCLFYWYLSFSSIGEF